MTPDLIKRYAAPVPRYTSYPTANHFSAAVTAEDYRRWLGELPQDAALSLYVHIPYCRELCWYCGCSTKATQRYAPVGDYLAPFSRRSRRRPRSCRPGIASPISIGEAARRIF